MAIRGSEALDVYDRTAEALPEAPELRAYDGAGLDAAARREIDPARRRAFRLFVAVVAVVCALGILRVQMTVWCVEALSENAELRSQTAEAEELARDLAVESSELSSAERIERIATQNLGLVYVGKGEPLASGDGSTRIPAAEGSPADAASAPESMG